MPHDIWNHSSPTGIESIPPAVEAQSLNHRTARQVPEFVFSNEGSIQVKNCLRNEMNSSREIIQEKAHEK